MAARETRRKAEEKVLKAEHSHWLVRKGHATTHRKRSKLWNPVGFMRCSKFLASTTISRSDSKLPSGAPELSLQSTLKCEATLLTCDTAIQLHNIKKSQNKKKKKNLLYSSMFHSKTNSFKAFTCGRDRFRRRNSNPATLPLVPQTLSLNGSVAVCGEFKTRLTSLKPKVYLELPENLRTFDIRSNGLKKFSLEEHLCPGAGGSFIFLPLPQSISLCLQDCHPSPCC